jgi:hypothetical protein
MEADDREEGRREHRLSRLSMRLQLHQVYAGSLDERQLGGAAIDGAND